MIKKVDDSAHKNLLQSGQFARDRIHKKSYRKNLEKIENESRETLKDISKESKHRRDQAQKLFDRQVVNIGNEAKMLSHDELKRHRRTEESQANDFNKKIINDGKYNDYINDTKDKRYKENKADIIHQKERQINDFKNKINQSVDLDKKDQINSRKEQIKRFSNDMTEERFQNRLEHLRKEHERKKQVDNIKYAQKNQLKQNNLTTDRNIKQNNRINKVKVDDLKQEIRDTTSKLRKEQAQQNRHQIEKFTRRIDQLHKDNLNVGRAEKELVLEDNNKIKADKVKLTEMLSKRFRDQTDNHKKMLEGHGKYLENEKIKLGKNQVQSINKKRDQYRVELSKIKRDARTEQSSQNISHENEIFKTKKQFQSFRQKVGQEFQESLSRKDRMNRINVKKLKTDFDSKLKNYFQGNQEKINELKEKFHADKKGIMGKMVKERSALVMQIRDENSKKMNGIVDKYEGQVRSLKNKIENDKAKHKIKLNEVSKKFQLEMKKMTAQYRNSESANSRQSSKR